MFRNVRSFSVTSCFYPYPTRSQPYKDQALYMAVLVKNRFLHETFEVFRRISGELFKIITEMRLIKKVIFVTDIHQGFIGVKLVEYCLETDD